MKNLITLPDGTEISSGTAGENAVISATLTDCVNNGDDLALGSACAKMLELSIMAPGANLKLTAGDEVVLYKVDGTGLRSKVGPFRLEKPTYPSANTMKLTGYDRITQLDKDLTAWIKALDGWPYDLLTFAGMVCEACGLTLTTVSIPNGDYPVRQFSKASVTGRQLLGWVGEICCRFIRADADGNIEFAWYTDSGVTVQAAGDNYYFAGSLTYENYQVSPIDAVQLQLADSDSRALWPEAAEGANSYIITGNPILMAAVTDDLLPYLQVIQQELEGVSYTPCKVSLPARLDVRAGSTVRIIDNNGNTITAYVMTKTQKGQRDTLECTGNHRRDSTSAVNNKTPDQIAQEKVDGQTQKDIFGKLTNYGQIQGIYVKDGKWYINAELVKVINLIADHVKSVLDGRTVEITGGALWMTQDGQSLARLSTEYPGYPVLEMLCHPGTELYGRLLVCGDWLGLYTDPSAASPPRVYMHLLDGKGVLGTDMLNDKAISWKSNGDGTYTLIGQ